MGKTPFRLRRTIYAEAVGWNKHGDHADVRKYDLSGDRYHTIGMETVLQCCGRILDDHGWIGSGAEAMVVCPGKMILTEFNDDSKPARYRVMTAQEVYEEGWQ